jgi:Cu+-exporting ATPase
MDRAPNQTIVLPVLGMSCAACQHHVEEVLRSSAGVAEARVDLMAHRATVSFDPAETAPEALIEAVRSAGYDAVLPHAEVSAEQAREQDATAARKAWVTLVAGALAMILAMPLGGEMGVIDHTLMRFVPWLYALPANPLRWFLLVATGLVVAWAGRSIYASALRALAYGQTNMNTLVGMGTTVAFLYSAYATLRPAVGRAVYFDAVLLILGFLLLGKSLEGRARQRAMAALDALIRLKPATARRVRDGVETVVPLEEIAVGESVRVLPGERFPVDATVLEGRTTVDESMLTGESTPLPREVGGRVLAGSLNYDGAVLCRAESLGEQTMLAQIARMVSQAQGSRAPMERLADRVSSIFVPTVMLLALITFCAWIFFTRSFEMALANMVAVLVVACPCAMGLAVPAALTVAVGRGAQLGVLFKGGEAVERLAEVQVVVLDKTGTLTVGRPVLEQVRVLVPEALGGLSVESAAHVFGQTMAFGSPEGVRMVLPPAMGAAEKEMLRLAAAAEERSNHPLAYAVVERARELNLATATAEEVQVLPGRGLSAQVDGRACLLGNEVLFAEWGIQLPAGVATSRMGVTRLWMALDGAVVGYFDARDSLQPDAADAVAALHRAGLVAVMLTGDSEAAARPIATLAGIRQMEAGLDPAGKLERIRQLQAEGLCVAMVGDGINDAAALAQADAGLAMGSGADLAQEAGDVLLLHARPGSIPVAIALSRATVNVMQQNLGWAAGYNLLGIPLAAGVLYPVFHILLTPWLAAAAMALSSICVLANSLRLRGWTVAASSSQGARRA